MNELVGHEHPEHMKESNATQDGTDWSLVFSALKGAEPQRRLSLEQLCKRYWNPVRRYFYQEVRSTADAEDLTQDFFLKLIQGDFMACPDPSKGRFRSYLWVCCRHFARNQQRFQAAAKRGGDNIHLSVYDCLENTALWDSSNPEDAFNRTWAEEVRRQAHEMLQARYLQSGKLDAYIALRPCLEDDLDAPSHRQIAERLGLTESHVDVLLHRLRHRLGECLRECVRPTLLDAGDLDEEVRLVVSWWK